ncbi:hypothetical protein ACFSCW_04930 [Sphingomonas tabacisoli]|uniref:Uncharacterized protein n=1 Tax=Sphingomonas tabacisoli TaxID=2249466 RepID=A0ABW4I0S7_9SPHN
MVSAVRPSEQSRSTPLGKLGWIVGVLIGAILLAFAAAYLINSQALVGSIHQRNAASLEIIARNLERWPRTAREIARARQPGDMGITVSHPDFGAIKIASVADCAATSPPGAPMQDGLFQQGQLAGQGTLYHVVVRVENARQPCYAAEASLQKLVGLDRSGAEFLNLLIVAPDQSVLEQFGTGRLPVAKLPPMTIVSGFARTLVQSALTDKPVSGDAPAVTLDSAPGAARVQIADAEYFAYVRPFRVADASGRPCPGTKPLDAAKPQAPPTSLGGCQLYAIGLMPASTLRDNWLRPPPLALMGFGLAVLIAIALIPVLRLLLIGGTESLSSAEVLAILFGMYAAAALATLAVLFVGEAMYERHSAGHEAARLAADIAVSTGQDVKAFRAAAERCRGGEPQAARSNGPLPELFESGHFDAGGRNPERGCGLIDLPPATDISARPYFRALVQRAMTEPGATAVLTEVRAQTDGVKKTALIEREAAGPTDACNMDASASPASGSPPPARRCYFLASTFLPSLVAPVLPPFHRFLVVDTSDERLPVIFHQESGRAMIENFADQIRAPNEIVQALRKGQARANGSAVGAPANPPTIMFPRRYDGRVASFAAAAIPDSPWAVLVYFPVDDADRIAAGTASRALGLWAGVNIAAMPLALWLLLGRRGRWKRIWPCAVLEETYRKNTPILIAAAVLIGAWSLLVGILAPVVAVAAAVLICGWQFRKLGRHVAEGLEPSADSAADADPKRLRLTLETERAYRRYALAMLACIAAAPMTAFWSDSRQLSAHLTDLRRADAAAMGVLGRARSISALQDVVRSAAPGSMPAPIRDAFAPWPDHPVPAAETAIRPDWTVAGFAREMQTQLATEPVMICRSPPAADWYCASPDDKQPIAARTGVRPRSAWLHDPYSWGAIAILALLLAGMIYAVVYQALWALTGFGIPLDAVTWPTLLLGRVSQARDGNRLKLARKSMLVAPQRAVRAAVCDGSVAIIVDLASELLGVPDALLDDAQRTGVSVAPKPWTCLPNGAPARLVVIGLELVLRDAKRRRAALAYLERAADALSPNASNCLASLVVIAEMSPLERILDAFGTHEETDEVRDSMREELRWARLFQDFTTFSFAPIDKLGPGDLGLPPECRRLAEELRWLPGTVIDGVIGDHSSANLQPEPAGYYPIDASLYQSHYRPLIAAWARAIDPVTEAAAVDFMRSNLIEYYEQCWAASSLPERVVLDAIARGGFVNMRKAVALQSLVRRGLIILDPAPRLMNKSFAIFIRQTERPDTLAAWRARQPKSAWSSIKLPMAIALPALVLMLGLASAQSGQELTALISLMAAGAPALIGSVLRTTRASA